MPIELKITAETVEEFDGLLARFHPGAAPARSVLEWGDKGVITDVAEVTPPLEPAAPKTRQRRAKDEPASVVETTTASTVAETASDAPSGVDEEHPLLVAKTLADVKALGNKKVGELGAGPVQQALADNFGVKAFGGLDPADYDRAYAVLEVLK